ncbi:unnamed protein product, partial [Lampetra planeri]
WKEEGGGGGGGVGGGGGGVEGGGRRWWIRSGRRRWRSGRRVRGDLVAPVGFSDRPLSVSNIREHDQDLVDKRCWDIALGPLKQIPMNLFIMYMAGNTISIFPIMMVCMMAWRPIQALMAMSS